MLVCCFRSKRLKCMLAFTTLHDTVLNDFNLNHLAKVLFPKHLHHFPYYKLTISLFWCYVWPLLYEILFILTFKDASTCTSSGKWWIFNNFNKSFHHSSFYRTKITKAFSLINRQLHQQYLSNTHIIKDIFVYFLRRHTILCLVIKSKWSKDLESPTSINSQQSIARVWFF